MSITKSDENEQVVSAQSSPSELNNKAHRAECLVVVLNKEFEEKIIDNQKPSIKPLIEQPPGNPKSNDPFAWANYRTTDRRTVRFSPIITKIQ